MLHILCWIILLLPLLRAGALENVQIWPLFCWDLTVMTTPKLASIATLVTCGWTCLAYEAIRINGWFNRFPSRDTSLFEVAFSQWNLFALAVYLSLFLPCVVVASNKSNPKIQIGWFLFSFAILVIALIAIPGAMHGRWAGTHDEFILIYWLVVPLLAAIFILFGKYARGNKTPRNCQD